MAGRNHSARTGSPRYPGCDRNDNTRDPFYAYGDLDAVEVFSQAVRIAQLDYPFGDLPTAITRTPAETMGLSDVGQLKAGPADMVIFERAATANRSRVPNPTG